MILIHQTNKEMNFIQNNNLSQRKPYVKFNRKLRQELLINNKIPKSTFQYNIKHIMYNKQSLLEQCKSSPSRVLQNH